MDFECKSPWRRPDQELLEAFGTASSAQVADCMSRLGAMDVGIKPIWPSPRVIGAALTVWCHAGDNLMLHKALSLAVPGDIVVVNTQGNVTNSPFGELLATSAVQVGIRAVIVDGTVRDAEALQNIEVCRFTRADFARTDVIRMGREKWAQSLRAAELLCVRVTLLLRIEMVWR